MRVVMSAAALAVACLVAPAHAQAQTIVQHDNELLMFGMARFDPNLGTLTGVTLKVDVNKSTYNQIYSTTAAAGDYAVSWVTNGAWGLSTAQYGSVGMAVTATGSATVNVVGGPGFNYGYFAITNITGSQTFTLDPAKFIASGQANRVILDGQYNGYYQNDAADTAFILPTDFLVRRIVGNCGGTYTGEDFCGSTNYTLTYDYTPAATSGVPEPATWAMLLIGFAGVGGALRRRSPIQLA